MARLSRRRILEALTGERLLDVVDDWDVEGVNTGSSKADLVEAVARNRSTPRSLPCRGRR